LNFPQDYGFSRWGPGVELETRKGRAIAILRGNGHDFADHGVLVDVIKMLSEVVWVANTMIGESALPHFRVPPDKRTKGMGVSALDQLDRTFNGDILCRREQNVNVVGHDYKGMQEIATLAVIAIKSLEKYSGIIVDDKQSAALPGAEG
jgi:hypothetical protein